MLCKLGILSIECLMVCCSDKYGMLALSPKQRDKFGKWMRPDSLCEQPQMIYAVSSFSIRQASHYDLCCPYT